MLNLLDSWLGWLGLGSAGLAALTGALWFTGMLPILGAALNIFNTILAVIAPFLTMAVKAITDGLAWAFQYVVWPGLKDILDSWATTVFTIVLVGVAVLIGMMVRTDARTVRTQQQVNTCVEQVKRANREEDAPNIAPSIELPWPFSFKW